jgi:hypothetical protein
MSPAVMDETLLAYVRDFSLRPGRAATGAGDDAEHVVTPSSSGNPEYAFTSRFSAWQSNRSSAIALIVNLHHADVAHGTAQSPASGGAASHP